MRLFEAAACGVPVISDDWPGLDELFEPGKEILVARSPEEVLHLIRELPERERIAIGQRARERVLARHTAAHRAEALESTPGSCSTSRARRSAGAPGRPGTMTSTRGVDSGEEVRET